MTVPSRRLEGRVALVSGAGGPMGQAIALILAAQGARLLLTDKSAGRLDATVKQLDVTAFDAASRQDRVVAVRANAMDRAEATAVVEAGLARYGRLDERERQGLLDRNPLRRLGRPGKIADAVAFLASDEYRS